MPLIFHNGIVSEASRDRHRVAPVSGKVRGDRFGKIKAFAHLKSPSG
jgi:hypothetical protein